MEKEMFQNIMQKDEEIIWAEGVNKKPFILKKAFKTTIGFAIAGIFLAQLATILTGFANFEDMDSMESVLKVWPITWLIVFGIGIIIGLIIASLSANNTFLAITNKRIIKRSGIFTTNYLHYSLKNVGNVSIQGSIFDSKGEDGSATLIIIVKDYHTNIDGNTRPMRLAITSLNKAYKAYNILSEQTEGNNESFRVKIEK